MKHSLIILTFLCMIVCGQAQSSEDAVKATIEKLFLGMKNADSDAIKACFTDSAILQTIVITKKAETLVRNESVTAFAQSISQIPKNAADERIVFDMIKIDGQLASAWTPYRFYFNNTFSHCGVNSFQLVQIDGIWKIQYLIDTRRKQDCEQ